MEEPILSADGFLPSVLNLARRHAWQRKLSPALCEEVAVRALGRALIEGPLTGLEPSIWVIRSVRAALQGCSSELQSVS